MKGQRLTTKQKNANNQQWFKDNCDFFDSEGFYFRSYFGIMSNYDRIRTNYDLYNGKINKKYYDYVCPKLGLKLDNKDNKQQEVKHLDIVANKINRLIGQEMMKPFSFRVVATNREATTRREQELFGKIKEYVIQQILEPLKMQIQQEQQAQLQQMIEENPDLQNTPEGQQQLQEQMQQMQMQADEQLKAMTPEEVKHYMEREYQDPAEVLHNQLLRYSIRELDVNRKFNEGFKDLMIGGGEFAYVGVLNEKPHIERINPLRISYDLNNSTKRIEEGEWASCVYFMTPTEIVNKFGDDLTDSDIDKIYEKYGKFGNHKEDKSALDLFAIIDSAEEVEPNKFVIKPNNAIEVIHVTWKALRKVGFLTYVDPETGEEQSMMVDDTYKMNTDFGDVEIQWEWFPEAYEAWKIKASEDIYAYMRPIPGQFKDIYNLDKCYLPYYGVVIDNCPMDKGRDYQYLYNILNYKMEYLINTDEGKKFFMNINLVPDSLGIDLDTWEYYRKISNVIYYNPNEEGNPTGQDANTAGKVIDLSLMSDIQKYQQLSEYVRQQCGRAMGVPDNLEGQTGQYEAVRNNQQNAMQSSYGLEPYFDIHNVFKTNVLKALIEAYKVAYSGKEDSKMVFMLDDLSKELINIDAGLLDGSTIGLFVENSAKTDEILQNLSQLAHAALQNQKIELSDFITLVNQDSIVEATETLKVAEKKMQELQERMQMQQQQHEKEMQEQQIQREREKFEEEKELLRLEYEYKKEIEVVKNALLGASFNPDQDNNDNEINDYIELARNGLDADFRVRQQKLEKEKVDHQKYVDNRKLDQEDRKISQKDKELEINKMKVKRELLAKKSKMSQ